MNDANVHFYFPTKRSTGLAANLTSPTNEFATTNKERSNSGDDKLVEKKDDMKGGSIVGLRSTKFSNLDHRVKASPSPEAKPRTGVTNASPNADESTPLGPKPKPLPKPRPWSIVGVDRKSGEVTSVGDKGDVTAPNKPLPPAKGSVRDLINNMNKNESSDKRKGSSLPRGTLPPDAEQSSANSPLMSKKTETSDDPRIMKLDDDYAYEEVV